MILTALDSELHPDLLQNPRVSIVPLPKPPPAWQTSNKILFLFLAPLKVLFQIWVLWLALGYRTKPAKWMLVQVGLIQLLEIPRFRSSGFAFAILPGDFAFRVHD